jgi:NTE family protein
LRYLDINFAGTSLMTGGRIEKSLAVHLEGVLIEDLPKRFAAIATDLATGQEVWLTRGSLIAALRASYALPGIFKPVRIGGRWLIDGALSNPVPVSAARAMGADFVIAVTIHADNYVKNALFPVEAEAEAEAAHSARIEEEPRKPGRLSAIKRQFFGKRERDAPPGLPRVMLEAFNITQSRIARSRLAGDPPDMTIQVNLDGVGLFDFHKAEFAIEQGRDAARRYLSVLPVEEQSLRA